MRKHISACLLKTIMLFVMAFCMVLSSVMPVFAEGSISMTSPRGNALAHRPYSYWTNTSSLGIPRQQKVNVYAKAGETLYFGSSVVKTNSIYVTTPGGVRTGYTIVNGGNGQINTAVKETTGPRYTDGSSGVKNANGYTPHSIDVTETGIFVFEFQSNNPTNTTQPTPTTIDALWSTNSTSTIGAWDVTVVKGVGTGISEVKRGRAFTNYLTLIMGKFFMNTISDWGKGLYSKVYVLTNDGYIYETDFNGLDPNGFIFFANNRGLINPGNNASLYHSARGTNDNLVDLKVTMPSGYILRPTVHLPNNADTLLDRTFKIFFEEPADDLPESIRSTPYMPGIVTDFRFYGDMENYGYVGQGGIFSFDLTSGSSYQIKIEFDDNYGGTGRPANTLYLSNAAVPGKNYIHWDGRDGNGYIVPAGLYGNGEGSDGSIKVYIEVKAGEYHFPMLDAENNPFGTKIRLVNTPYHADGTLHTWDTPEEEERDRTTVYYDNSLIISKGSTATAAKRNQTVGGVTRGSIWDEIDQQLYALDGISSHNGTYGASRFMGTSAGAQGSSTDAWIYAGDHAFVDIWTYTVGERTTESELTNFTLRESDDPEVEHAVLKGLVFYDKDSNRAYNIQNGDYALYGVKVELFDGTTLIGTEYTDIHGMYYFFDLIPGKSYGIKVTSPYLTATFTTPTTGTVTTTGGIKQLTFNTAALAKGVNSAVDVGLFYDLYTSKIQVTKEWIRTVAQDPMRPGQITVNAIGSYDGTDYVTVHAVLNNDNGWTHIFNELPAKNDLGNNLDYRIEETGAAGYISTTAYQITGGGELILYTITNTPREVTVFKQIDEPFSSEQHFLFTVEGDVNGSPGTDITFNIVLKIPAGSTEARQTLTHLHAGTYTVTELDTNWRYEFVISETKGKIDDVDAAVPVGRGLTMTVSDAVYYYIFKNELTGSSWLDFNTSVSNKMKEFD